MEKISIVCTLPGEAAEDAEGEAAEGEDAAVGEAGHVDGKEEREGVFGRQAAGIIETI